MIRELVDAISTRISHPRSPEAVRFVSELLVAFGLYFAVFAVNAVVGGILRKLLVPRSKRWIRSAVRTAFPALSEFRETWSDPDQRATVIAGLEVRGVRFDRLVELASEHCADPFDLLCHFAYNAPLQTRHERAAWLRHEHADFFEQFGPAARAFLDELVCRYERAGAAELMAHSPSEFIPFPEQSSADAAELFGGADRLHAAVSQLQRLLYAA
jgi:type I restriction enzyme R subunit